MLGTPPTPARFASIKSLLAILALTGPFTSASALSAQDGALHVKRDFDPPGLGVELEMIAIQYQSTKKQYKDMTPEEKEKLKGKRVDPIDFEAGQPKDNWDVTAEIAGTYLPYTEIITDGTKNIIGAHKTKDLGDQITAYMKKWAPCRDKGCQVNIDQFPDWNPWNVQWPMKERDFNTLPISPQVTAAMPLEGLLQVLKDGKAEKDNVLGNKRSIYHKEIVIPTKESFKLFGKIKLADITDEFLGFFSLLTTYCVVSKLNDPQNGPKQSLNIMPRTDFLGMYKKFIEEKLRDEISNCGHSLYDIVSEISGVENDGLKDFEFKWQPIDLRNDIQLDWDGKADMIKTGRLNVKKFLDTLQMNDKVAKKQLDLVKLMDLSTRHGQIGGLNDRMESVVGQPGSPAPIFEFRDLDPTNGADLANKMAQYEDKAIDLHRLGSNANKGLANVFKLLFPAIAGNTNDDAGKKGECLPNKTICPPGQTPIGATGKCMDIGPISKE